MAFLISATFVAFTGVFVALPPMLRNCAEVVPRFTLVLFTLAAADGALSPDFAIGARAFTSPPEASGKEVLELSIFTGITFFLVRLYFVSAA
jgi:hypothetical protein